MAPYTRQNLDSESFSPQRIFGTAASRKVCPKGFWFLGVVCVVGVSPGLPFAIDRAKWNIGFPSTFVLICRLFLALLLSGVKILSTCTSIFRNSPYTVILLPKVTQVSLKYSFKLSAFLRMYRNWTMCVKNCWSKYLQKARQRQGLRSNFEIGGGGGAH